MPERAHTTFEINDPGPPAHAEAEPVVVESATDTERATRAVEMVIDPDMADERVEALDRAREAVAAQFETTPDVSNLSRPMERDDSERSTTLSDVQLTPDITVTESQPEVETNAAVLAAKAHLREVQLAKEEKGESKETRSLMEKTHENVAHALEVIKGAESLITENLNDAQKALTWIKSHLEAGNIDKGTIYELTEKAENCVEIIGKAVSLGSEMIKTPLEMVKKVTSNKEVDGEIRQSAEDGERDLREAVPGVSDADINLLHKALNGIKNASGRPAVLKAVEYSLTLVEMTQDERAANKTKSGANALDKLEKAFRIYRAVTTK